MMGDFFEQYYDRGKIIPVHRYEHQSKNFFPLANEDFEVYWIQEPEEDFIHRNWQQFLQEEANQFFTQVVLPFLQSLTDFKTHGGIIIKDFLQRMSEIGEILARIEQTKIKLWERNPCIIRTDFCLSLGRIPENLWFEIFSNQFQLEEWKQLFPAANFTQELQNVQRILSQGKRKPPSENQSEVFAIMRNFPTLPVDTGHFPPDFIHKLRKALPSLDAECEGICIKGENWHALRYLHQEFAEQMNCIYIDPPYNTGNEGFLYNDKYPHYTWLVMLKNRLELAKGLLSPTGIFYCSIDDNEQPFLKVLVDYIFGSACPNIIWHKKTQPSFLTKELIPVTEYVLMAKKSPEPLRLWGSFGDKEKLTEMINISNTVAIRTLPANSTIIANGWTGVLTPGWYGKDKLQVELLDQIAVTDGKADKDIRLRSRFKWLQKRIDSEVDKGGIIHIKSVKSLRPTIARSYEEEIVRAPTTLLSKKINDFPTNTDGNREMKDFFGISPFDYPKPSKLIKYLIATATYFQKGWVLDFFAGSGTTAQAVIELNAEDNGKRHYILCEKEQHFNTVMLPRIKKVIGARKWQDGIPQILQGYQHILKIIHIK
jgi:16S rRNA G966 N2-methylase RsmD